MTSFSAWVRELEEADPIFKEQLAAARERHRDDGCPGCGAPAGLPPAGPCDNHGTAQAVATSEERQP